MRAIYAGDYRENPFTPGITKCYFCSKRFHECPEVYTYRSRHGQPFIFCQQCHRTRYITKSEAKEILAECKLEPIVVSSVAEGKKISIAKSAGRTIAHATEATTKAGVAVAPVVVKAGVRTVQMTAKVGAKVLPVVAKAGVKTVIGIAKLGGKAIMAIGRIGVRTAKSLPSPLSLPEYTSRPTFSTDSSIGISPDGIPLVGRVTEMASVNNPRKITEVFLLESKNPTLVVPITSRKQMEHLYRAQSQLSKAGVTFDTGTNISPSQRDWELDWSLKGAHIRNPKAYYIIDKLGRVRLIKKKNPTTQSTGNMLGGLGVLSVPIFIGLIVWLNRKYGK